MILQAFAGDTANGIGFGMVLCGVLGVVVMLGLAYVFRRGGPRG